MTKRDLHRQSDQCPPDARHIHVTCESPDNDTDWFRVTLLFVITWILIFILSLAALWWWWTQRYEDDLRTRYAQEIAACAAQGSIHPQLRDLQPQNQSRRWLRPQPPGQPNQPHPPGTCHDIKKIIHQSIDYCEDCEKGPPDSITPEPPLVLGGRYVDIEISDHEECSGDIITGITVDRTGNSPNQEATFTADDLDLPHFCPASNEHRLGPNNNRRLLNAAGNPTSPDPTREWELLERPRVHYARTIVKPLPGAPLGEIDPEFLEGGPYVVFIAKHLAGICCDEDGRHAVRDKERVTVFILYLDWVTEQPTIIEFDVEVERGKEIISEEDTVQLLSNVRLDSINKQITFQIGKGARRIVVAGYDFSGQSTTSDTGRQRRSDQDTSGSYRIYLTGDGAVEGVARIDL